MGYHGRGNFGAGFALGAIVGGVLAGVAFKNRKKIMGKVWQLKAKAQVHRRVAELREITRERYNEIVDEVLGRYRTMKDIAAYEVDALRDELKGRFADVKRQFEEAAEEMADGSG